MAAMVDFVLFDSETEWDNIVNVFEEASGLSLSDGDVQHGAVLRCLLYLDEMCHNDINTQANNNFALYCDEVHLIYKGAEQNTYRLEAEKATLTERFTVSGYAPDMVEIPAGSRVTADGETFFAVDEAVIVAPGSYADIPCTATEAGAAGNGYSVGQVVVMADVIPYVEAVSNVTASSGGSDRQSLEDFREAVQFAPLAYNTCGSEGGIITKAKKVSAAIADVAVTASGANVNVYILLQDGELPGAALLAEVKEALDDPRVHHVTDNITALPAERVSYAVDVSYKIAASDYAIVTELKDAIETAITEYIAEAGSKMGTKINPEMLAKAAYTAGAASVTVTLPVFTDTAKYEVPYCTGRTITYTGLLGGT